MIKAIEIENFKCIGERQRIELAPITLLFGPNSAGKSTVIQALVYAFDILIRGDCSPKETLLGGAAMNLGDFRDFVHLHDISRSISLKVEVGTGQSRGLIDGDCYTTQKRRRRQRFDLRQCSCSIELTISWSSNERGPYVSKYEIGVDGIWIARIETSYRAEAAVIASLNWIHPRFLHTETKLATITEKINTRRSKLGKPLVRVSRFPDPSDDPQESPGSATAKREQLEVESPMGRLFINGHPAVVADLTIPELGGASEFASLLGGATGLGRANILRNGPSLSISGPLYWRFPYDDTTGHCFNVDPLGFHESEWPRFDPTRENHAYVRNTIIEMVLQPIERVGCAINALKYVGPLRVVPGLEHFRGNEMRVDSDDWSLENPEWSGWAAGRAAWTTSSHLRSPDLRELINVWLAEKSHLDTGHKLKKIELVDGNLSFIISDSHSDVELRPNSVGVGFSQLLPVVLAAITSDHWSCCIEQPELHMHPRVQVRLADLFIFCIGRENQFVIETHSEHLLLRLLRRVRETYAEDRDPGAFFLCPSDLAVHYVEKAVHGTVYRQLSVNEEGDFSGDWPRGFFEERNEELF